MDNGFQLNGKRILVAGATGSIGQACAYSIASLGANAILLGRNKEQLKDIAERLPGSGHSAHAFDLSELNGIEAMLNAVVAESGKLDGLLYCAGVVEDRPFAMLKPSVLQEIMTINFMAFCELSRAYAKKKNNNGGTIVAVSSIAAEKGDKGRTAYCASKAAINGAVRAMAKELAEKGIRVNSLMPGMIRSDMLDKYVDRAGKEALERNFLTSQYLGLGEPNDVANMACYLLSDAAKFITGAAFAVDGGYLS